jgi:hypothetical protein
MPTRKSAVGLTTKLERHTHKGIKLSSDGEITIEGVASWFKVTEKMIRGVFGSDAEYFHFLLPKGEPSSLQDAYERLTLGIWQMQNLIGHIQGIYEDEIMEGVGSKFVFIGHGRATAWKELKDFISDRLGLEWIEFNRESAAGLTTSERLESMLSTASFAFLVLTAEDEDASGRIRPRQNVIHELGLFQGKLGLRRAIVMLEEGCEVFSNIHGLTHIPFPRSNISASFEEVRRVLEREGIIPDD